MSIWYSRTNAKKPSRFRRTRSPSMSKTRRRWYWYRIALTTRVNGSTASVYGPTIQNRPVSARARPGIHTAA